MDGRGDMRLRTLKLALIIILFGSGYLALSTCSVIKGTYKVGKGTVKATYKVTKGATKLTLGTGKALYTLGGFTFKVVMAPLTWPLTREEIESIDDLPPKEAMKLDLWLV